MRYNLKSSTRDKIIAYLNTSPDHAAYKRAVIQRMSYRVDFQSAYDALLADGVIEEFSYHPRMVCLSFKFTFRYSVLTAAKD
jgi:hypothetical protein